MNIDYIAMDVGRGVSCEVCMLNVIENGKSQTDNNLTQDTGVMVMTVI
jgi:hypothetical protein